MKFSLATIATILIASRTTSALQGFSSDNSAIQQRDEGLVARGEYQDKEKRNEEDNEDDDEDDEDDEDEVYMFSLI